MPTLDVVKQERFIRGVARVAIGTFFGLWMWTISVTVLTLLGFGALLSAALGAKPTPKSGPSLSLAELSRDTAPIPSTKREAPALKVGEVLARDGLEISVQRARIGKVDIIGLGGGVSKEDLLSVSLQFRNTHDRRITVFNPPGFGSAFSAADDFGNRIRGASFGFTDEPKGALSAGTEILPGQTATHVEVFAVPPPKTEFLVLVMDLSVIGLEGEGHFLITRQDMGM